MSDARTTLDAAHAALGSFIWLGNNLHNAGTETFREFYRAALEDAEVAYKATTEYHAALAAQMDPIDAYLASPQAAEELARALAPHQTEAGPFSALVDEGDRWHYHLASPSEFASVLLTAWQKLRHPEEP